MLEDRDVAGRRDSNGDEDPVVVMSFGTGTELGFGEDEA